MTILEFLKKKLMKKIYNLNLLNIGFPCFGFPNSITKRKLLFNNFKLPKSKYQKTYLKLTLNTHKF